MNNKHKLGVIVAYRERKEHLKQFIPHIQNFLKDLPHHIYIIEEEDNVPFNPGKLRNVGFTLAKEKCDYVCFHDVDMLPKSADYSYPDHPILLATHVEQFDFDVPYPQYFGGVTLFNCKDFEKINGYCNSYWGWGCEDDDLRLRCLYKKLKIDSRPGFFLSLSHEKHPENDPLVSANRELCEEFLHGNTSLQEKDGLNTLFFKILKETNEDKLSHYLVNIKDSTGKNS